jgi:hypothetical protein
MEMSDKDIEENYFDVLQNIEMMVVSSYDKLPQMQDSNVLTVYDALGDFYIAQKIGRPPRNFNLSPNEEEVFDSLKEVCDWRLGLKKTYNKIKLDKRAALSIDELLVCIKRLKKSLKFWNKETGRKGYLDFIKNQVG